MSSVGIWLHAALPMTKHPQEIEDLESRTLLQAEPW